MMMQTQMFNVLSPGLTDHLILNSSCTERETSQNGEFEGSHAPQALTSSRPPPGQTRPSLGVMMMLLIPSLSQNGNKEAQEKIMVMNSLDASVHLALSWDAILPQYGAHVHEASAHVYPVLKSPYMVP